MNYTTISPQAFAVFVTGIITGTIITFIYPKLCYTGLIIILTLFVLSYNINCTIKGRCYTWATFLSVVYIINMVVVVYYASTNKTKLIKLLKK